MEAYKAFFEKLYSNERVVPPSMKWKAVSPEEYARVYAESTSKVALFWAQQALELKWEKPWTTLLSGKPPRIKWFVDGYINAYYNIVGKHRGTWVWGKPAIIWEGEEGVARAVTYGELDEAATRLASALTAVGVKPGDWIVLYMPPTVEFVATALAAVKVGAPFEAVFTGFGYYELAKRVRNRKPKVLVVADGFYRRGKVIDTLGTVRRAVEEAGYEGLVVVAERLGAPSLKSNEVSLEDFARLESKIPGDYVAESTYPLFGLHSGYEDDYKPIAHPTGGFLVQVYSTSRWMGLRPRDTYFCTVWPGWITGISYVVFGPLMIGATIVLYDGSIDYPSWDRWWSILEDYAVTLFLTTSGALRLLARAGDTYVRRRDLDTLRAILVTAEFLERDVWWWTYRVVGTGSSPLISSNPEEQTGRIPVVNMYIQSEIGTFVTGNLVNYTFPPLKPGSAGPAIPGFRLAVEDGGVVKLSGFGELVVLEPWPSMPVEYPSEYVEKWRSGYYRTGDYAYASEDGYFYVLGRVDGVFKVSGYRLSPGALEKALKKALGVEAYVLACTDELKLNSIVIAYSGSAEPHQVKSTARLMVGAISEPTAVLKVSEHQLEMLKEKGVRLLSACSENLEQQVVNLVSQ